MGSPPRKLDSWMRFGNDVLQNALFDIARNNRIEHFIDNEGRFHYSDHDWAELNDPDDEVVSEVLDTDDWVAVGCRNENHQKERARQISAKGRPYLILVTNYGYFILICEEDLQADWIKDVVA